MLVFKKNKSLGEISPVLAMNHIREQAIAFLQSLMPTIQSLFTGSIIPTKPTQKQFF